MIFYANIQMEQYSESSANGLRNLPLNPPKVEIPKNAKKGGARYSFQQRASQQQMKRRNSKLNSTTPNAFEKADWDLAVKNTKKKMNRYYKGKQVGIGVDLEHFKIYGPGIYLFFSFLKSLTVAFLMMSIVQLLPIIYNYCSGNGLSTLTVSINYYFAKTTIGSFSADASNSLAANKHMNVISDMVSIFIFIVFYFFWLYRSDKLTEDVRREVKLKSYNVVEIIEPSPNVTEGEVKQLMSQFGTVLQVAAVKDYDQTIYLSKNIFELQLQVKHMQLQYESEPSEKLQLQIKEKKQQIDEVYKELVLHEDDNKEDIIKYFVTFSNIEERQKALKELTPYKPKTFDCCSESPPPQFLLAGHRVNIEACHTEPGEIIWQNQHVTWKTRWMRALVQFILLLTVVVVGFLIISFLNILAPPATTTVDTSSYSETTIKSQSSSTIVQSWCISNMKTVFSSSDSDLTTLCSGYIKKYYLKIAITVGIALAVLVIKKVINLVVVFLAKFQRYKSHTEQSKDITQNLFITYICTTVLITILLQAVLGNISFKTLISYFISNDYLTENLSALSEYSDFVSNWYASIGYQIVLTWVIMIVHPALTMLIPTYLQECFKESKAREMEIHAQMEKTMEPMQFQIEDNYANILVIVFVSLALSSGIPLITVVSFFALAFRYFYLKYIFIRYCKIPKTIDEALDQKVSGLLPYSVLLHFMIGIWMFGVTTIFSSDSSSFNDWVNGFDYAFLQQIAFILARMLGTWYYSLFFLVVVFVFIFKVIVYNLVVSNLVEKPKDTEVVQVRAVGDQELLNMSTKDICNSYRIENNPDYTEIMSIMHKKRRFVVRVKDNSK